MTEIKQKKISVESVIAIAILSIIFIISLFSIPTVIRLRKTPPSDFESSFNSSFPFKNAFVDINGMMHCIMGQKTMNGVIKLQNGQLTECISDTGWTDNGLECNARSVSVFSDWLNEKGIDFLYCQLPYKISKYEDSFPKGVYDYSNEVADKFVDYLTVYGVAYLDIRECLRSDRIDYNDIFFRTEHHWNTDGGFYAFSKICEYLGKKYGTTIDEKAVDKDNYQKVVCDKTSLGYYGTKTGWIFSGFDEFYYYSPLFDTVQSCSIPHRDEFRSGKFDDAVFDWSKMNVSWRDRGLYHTFIGGDYPIVIHESETAANDETVMLFIDSFGIVPEAYFTTNFKKVVAVDLRWVSRNGWEKTAVDFVEEFEPKTVIIMFNPSQLGNADSEQFEYGLK